MWERIKCHARWVRDHRTKVAGLIGVGAGYLQHNLALLGHVLPDQWNGVLVGILGAVVFFIGFYNTFIE